MVLTAMATLMLASCGTASKVPLTGRTHRISSTYSDSQILSLSNQEYTKYMSTAKRSSDATNTAMVTRVGQRLANAVESYLRSNGYANEVNNFAWEFNLVADKQANAFCMPGGKIMAHLAGFLPLKQVLRRENPR